MSDEKIPRTAEQSFPGSKGSVADMRAWSRVWMEKFGVPAEVADNAVLVLSELCTNALQHSRSSGPHGSYLVLLRWGVSTLRVEVTDAGGVSEPMAQCSKQQCGKHLGNGEPFSLAESGHGLALVEAFATRWWTRGNSRSRTVCAELPLT